MLIRINIVLFLYKNSKKTTIFPTHSWRSETFRRDFYGFDRCTNEFCKNEANDRLKLSKATQELTNKYEELGGEALLIHTVYK